MGLLRSFASPVWLPAPRQRHRRTGCRQVGGGGGLGDRELLQGGHDDPGLRLRAAQIFPLVLSRPMVTIIPGVWSNPATVNLQLPVWTTRSVMMTPVEHRLILHPTRLPPRVVVQQAPDLMGCA